MNDGRGRQTEHGTSDIIHIRAMSTDGLLGLSPIRQARQAKPAMLSAYLVTCTGLVSTFKGPQAAAIAAAIYKLAKHHADEGDDDVILDCATEYLRLAPILDVNMGEQADRWRAFRTLANPEDRRACPIAQRSTVLADVDSGRRLVLAGWFQSYVRADVGGVYSPAALAVRAQPIGWIRPNREGRVKATNPSDGRCLGWSFYVIPADWDSGRVPAGSGSIARTHTCARKTFRTRRNPEPERSAHRPA